MVVQKRVGLLGTFSMVMVMIMMHTVPKVPVLEKRYQ